jgi:FkbM family methyltransferase
LRAREWVNAALARFPIRRRLVGSGVRFDVETFETLAVERAYLGNPLYAEVLGGAPPETFIDLGCNSGIFPCLLAHLAGGRAPRGLCIDANAAQVKLAERTVALNGWKDIYVRCGLVGNRVNDRGAAEFFLHPTSLGSSQFAYEDSESGRRPDWKRVMVPSLEVTSTWEQLFGPETRCGCLKIDIEGSEMHFLRQEAGLLARVEAVLLEWHSWATTREEVTRFLGEQGFALARTIEDSPRCGVLYFRAARSLKSDGSGD